jgi:hypothetical protein
MAPFEELQELWQSQNVRAPEAFDVRGLSEELQRFGRQQNWINCVKLSVAVLMFFRLMARFHWVTLAVAGYILMAGGLLVYLVMDWRNQIGISRLDFSAPSVEFVRKGYERLQHQLNPMRKLFWPLAICIGGGFNLILASRGGPFNAFRLAGHLTATALPFAAYVLGCKIREFRFKRECGAVLEKLESLLRAMEEQSL